jgi:predicted RecA/RadA family phage recombinase
MTTAIYVQDDDYVDYTPTADVASGDVVVQGDLVGVARKPIPAGTLGALAVEGVFDFAKATGGGSGFAAGTKVYFDATNKVATATVGSNKYLGKTVRAAADADTTVRVALSSSESAVTTDIPADTITAAMVKDGEVLPVGVAVPDTKQITFGTSALTRNGNNIIATLPAADPGVAGALYVTAGAVKVSAGS